MIKSHDKTEIFKLCDTLDHEEFKCHCNNPSCRMTLVDDDLIEAYTHFRFYMGQPLHINDGYRCPQHNMEVGGVAKSTHQMGKAIDISLIGISIDPGKIQRLAFQAGFKFFKLYADKHFFHIDTQQRGINASGE